MIDYSIQNKAAWEYNAYQFWIKEVGLPEVRAEKIRQNPVGELKKYAAYFDTYKGMRIANICGSCGKKAVPLALLGAKVTVFDISKDNQKYALELAKAAGTELNYVVCDVLEIDAEQYGGCFDIVFMEGGILHYFHDIDAFMQKMHLLLKAGGKMICSDFHPFTKISDLLEFEQKLPRAGYFSTEIFEGEMAHARFFEDEIRAQMPKCSYRKYTISEIINAVVDSGFVLQRFDEHPAWTNQKLPGEFTIVAVQKECKNTRLAAFESMFAAVQKEYADILSKMEKLKAEGKVKTVTYQQLLARKMTYQNMLAMYEIYDLKGEIKSF